MSLPTEKKSTPATDEWYTPAWVYEGLGMEFALDPCSPGKDVIPWSPVKLHWNREVDGLKWVWGGTVFCNPPYSEIAAWMKRFMVHDDGIALVYARVETKWCQTYAMAPGADICFPNRRIAFEGPLSAGKKQAPKAPSMLVARGPAAKEGLRRFARKGLGTLWRRL